MSHTVEFCVRKISMGFVSGVNHVSLVIYKTYTPHTEKHRIYVSFTHVLLSGAGATVGVIDFGDIVNGWVVSDVAIAAAYATVSSYGKEHPFAAAAAMLHGVAQEFELTEVC